jgi:hypothetical protein
MTPPLVNLDVAVYYDNRNFFESLKTRNFDTILVTRDIYLIFFITILKIIRNINPALPPNN